MTRVKRGDTSDFLFDFETVPPIESENTPFFPDQFDNYVGKHKNFTTSGIIFFNESTSTQKPKLKNPFLEIENSYMTVEPEKPIITYKILEVSNVLIITGALTITTLALILMCCFFYGCKSRERRYINRDTVRAHVLSQNQNSNPPMNLNSANNPPYDTQPLGHSTNPVDSREYHEMINIIDLDQSSTSGLTNRAYYESPNRPAILPVSQHSAVSTGQRRLISVL